jgi:hypothetical protein
MSARRRRAIGTIAALAIFAVPIGIYFGGRPSHQDALERAVVDLQFFPIRPPTTLRGPGSLYHVDVSGNILGTVCEADQVLVSALSQESPTTLLTASALQEAEYSIEGGVIEKINAKLKTKQVQSVRLSLQDVRVLEIPQADLTNITARLVKSSDCSATIKQLLNARELVCQGASVLLASAEYSTQTEQGTTTDATLAAHELEVVSKALKEANIDGSATVKAALGAQSGANVAGSGTRLVSGRNLYYGIKTAPLCMTPPDAPKEWRIPRNAVERVIYRLWQLSPV